MFIRIKHIFVSIIIFSFIVFNCNNCSRNIVNPIAKDKKWTNGIIPYYISKDFSFKFVQKIKKAMRIWEKGCKNKIRFVQVNNLKEYKYVYHIKPSYLNFSSSTVGYTNNNYAKLNPKTTLVIILHELGHCIGLNHEHQRKDRNKYIKVLHKNINPDFLNNFKIFNSSTFLYNPTKYSYDFNSIMHYNVFSFSKNYYPTIVSTKKNMFKIMNVTTISEIDCLKCIDIYK